MENGVDVVGNACLEEKAGSLVSEESVDEVFQEAIGTAEPDPGKEEGFVVEGKTGVGVESGVGLGSGSGSGSGSVSESVGDGFAEKFEETVGGEIENGLEDKVVSSVVSDGDGVSEGIQGKEVLGDDGEGSKDKEEEESKVVGAVVEMEHSIVTSEVVETSGLEKGEIADSGNVVLNEQPLSEGADSDNKVLNEGPVPGGVDSDNVVLNEQPLSENADSGGEAWNGQPISENADSGNVVLNQQPLSENVDSDNVVLNEQLLSENADSDNVVLNEQPLSENADSGDVVLNRQPISENADSDNVVLNEQPLSGNADSDNVGLNEQPLSENAESDNVGLNEQPLSENAESDKVVLNEQPLPENADSEHVVVNERSVPGTADSDDVVLNGRPVPQSAENANSDCVGLKGIPAPESADLECVVLKGGTVPESGDISPQGETNGKIMAQGNGKTAEPVEFDLGNGYKEDGTVDHAGNPHMEIQDGLSTEVSGNSASTDAKHEASEKEGEKGAETVLNTGHGADNAALKDLQHNGGTEKKSAVPDSVGTDKKSADAGSSSAKSTNAAASLPSRPAGLGRAAPLLEPAHRVAPQPRANGTVSPLQAQQAEEANGDGDEYDVTREKLQMIRVKFLRLAHRLGQTPHNVVVAQVLYRLGLAEQLRGSSGGRVGAFSFDRASSMAEQLEAAGQEPLDFSCTIMVLGKSGVGKSATINSLFDEPKFTTDAFQMGTRKVQDVVGTVQGIKVRVIDTPGLLPSWSDQHRNEKILQSVKRFIKKTPPDIVLYLDRLDMQSRDLGDMPLLRTITEIFGPSIWFNAIVVLTHAASAPPDGPNGTASSYDMFVTQRSHVVQQAIRQAAGDMRLMNPVSLVENHSACRTNRAGQRVLPNGQVWKPHLLLLSFASKILAEANALLKLQDSPPGKPFVTQSRAPPLPYLLSSLLQSRPPLKLPEEQQYSDDEDDVGESSDSDNEMDYDDLPPFKSLSKAQLAKLNKDQKKAYFDELEYREKLLMKKQLKEESKRRKMMKKMAAAAKDQPSEFNENVEEESSGAASVPVPMPDLALPASFDADNPTHRYRYLDTSSPWLVRPVLDTNGWDHDVGYEGINAERLFVVKEKVPVSLSGQVTKDKKDSNVQMEVASSIKHGKGKATSLGFDMHSVGKDLAYTLRSETRFSNFKKNKASAGLSLTLLGDVLSAGVKLEDKLILNRRFQMVVSGGAMGGRGDIAYGGSLEAQLRDKDYPLGRSLSTLGVSVMDWHGDLAIGCNLQSQIPLGRSTNLIARANLNNRGSGQVSVRLNSSEQLQLVLIGLVPLLRKLVGVSQQQFGQ